MNQQSNNEIDIILKKLAKEYNNSSYFINDPIIFPKHFAKLYCGEQGVFSEVEKTPKSVTLADIEIAAVIAAHLAWGRRDMIVRDIHRAMDEMSWQPYNYIMAGNYRADDVSLHRTIKWSEFAKICSNLKEFYTTNNSLEHLTAEEFRVKIYGQKSDKNAACKKIHMLRRWMIRCDGIVDLGVWRESSPTQLIIPLDVHVHRSALNMGITARKSADIKTAMEITEYLLKLFPEDPCIGDFALFAYAASEKDNLSGSKKDKNTK